LAILQRCRPVVARASALGCDLGVVLALQFSAYGEARKSLAAGGAWVVPVFCAAALRGHTHTYMIHTCRRAWALTVCCFSYSNTRDWTAKVKQTCHWSYNILFYSVGEKTEANKVDYIYHIRLRAFDLDRQFLSAIPRSYRCERDDTETRCSSQPLQRLRRGAHYILAILATLSHLLHPATPAVKAHHAPIPHGLVGHRSTGPWHTRLQASFRTTTCSLRSSTITTRTALLSQVPAARRRILLWKSSKSCHSQQFEICWRCTKSYSLRRRGEGEGARAQARESRGVGLRSR
jgi:hypothetical protein